MIDLAASAQVALEAARTNLTRDKQLLPVAIVYAPGREFIVGMHFDSPHSKQRAYKKLHKIAKRSKALAVILVNDVWIKSLAGLSEAERQRFLNSYRGSLALTPGRSEAIVIVVKAPGAPLWGLQQAYERHSDGEIVFGAVENTSGNEMVCNLLSDW